MPHTPPALYTHTPPGPPHRAETLPGGTFVWTNETHRIGTDALLLAAFCGGHKNWNVCDLGTGCGVLLLSLWDVGIRGHMEGIELDEAGAALLAGGAHQSGAQLQALAGDICQYRPDILFDLVVANPPYFTQGQPPPAQARANARHQLAATLQDFCAAAERALKTKGRFCVCYPAAQLATLMHTMRGCRLEPKRMQLARTSHENPPWLVMVDARKDGGEGLQILPDIILPPGQAVHY